MRLLELELENFGVHGQARVPLDDQGLVLVEGRNLDAEGGSNGAGKTSLLADPITWALFGVTTRGRRLDVIRRGAPAACVRVRLRTDAGQDLEVERHRTATAGRVVLRVNGQDESPATLKLAEARLQAHLRVPLRVWSYSTILGQGLAFRFADLTDQERGALLEDILGVHTYGQARETVRQQVQQVEQEARRQEEAARTWRARAEEAQRALEATQTVEDGPPLAKLERRAEALRRALAAAEPEEATARKAADGAARALGALREEEASRRATAAAADKVYRRLVSRSECPTCTQPIPDALRQRLAATAAMQAHTGDVAAQTLAERLEAAARSTQQARDELERCAAVLRDLRGKCAAVEAQIGERTRQTSSQEALRSRLGRGIAKATEEADRAEAAARAAKAAASYPGWWVDGFAELRAARIAQAADFLNERIRHYCGELLPAGLSAYLVLDTKRTGAGVATALGLEVTTGEQGYRAVSGGEKDRIDLAVAFALHDLVQATSGWSCNVLVADEIGTHVDPEGVAKLVGLLRAKAEAVGSVFVMSQSPVWKTHLERVWTVVREGGVARLERRR
jgi:DNA repair exonuclease SbcCD ATPase subunit